MKSPSIKLLLEVIPRIAAASVLWENIDLLIREMPRYLATPEAFLTIFSGTEGFAAILGLATAVLSVLAVVTASPLLYASTLTLLAIAKGVAGYAVSSASVFCLLLLLFADSVKLTYRSGQRASLRIPLREILKGIVGLSAVLCLTTVLVLVASRYAEALIEAFTVFSSVAVARSNVLALLFMNPVVKLLLVLLFVTSLYKFISHSFDSLALFVFPSRRIALDVLRRRGDIDLYIEAPLNTLKGIMISMAVAPLLYAAMYKVVIPAAVRYVPELGYLTTFVARIAISFLLFTLAYVAVTRFSQGFLRGDVRSVLVLSLTITLFVYSSAVLLTLWRGHELVEALLRPDLEGLGREVVSSYVRFYALFFYLLELLLRLVGAAP